ncbi:MAG TPA: FadR/GntR family transcriptional regulator [Castellaniella sp.]|uniref:FadR/GntR family transcriptional regulator n=1 Tax=Castellaniella sp. TaxID=1955812 RepID=UPI002EE59D59
MKEPVSFLHPAGSPRNYLQVADALRKVIAETGVRGGGRLPSEREFALQLNISRPSVREALIVLELGGEIEIRVGSGIYLRQSSTEAAPAGEPDGSLASLGYSPYEVNQIRRFLEGGVAAHAAQFITSAQLKKLDAHLASMYRGLEHHPGSEDRQLVMADRKFHLALASVTHNRLLVHTIEELFDQRYSPLPGSLRRLFENRMVWEECVKEHQDIYDAVASHDPLQAEAAMRRHLTRAHARLMAVIDE